MIIEDGFIINRTNDGLYSAITKSYGKINFRSKYLYNFYPGLTKGIFISYEFLPKKGGSFLEKKIFNSPESLFVNEIISYWKINYPGSTDLIFFICNYFIYEGVSTEKIFEIISLLRIENEKIENENNFILEIIINLINEIEQISNEKLNKLNIILKLEKDQSRSEFLFIYFKDIFNLNTNVLYKNNIKLLDILKYCCYTEF